MKYSRIILLLLSVLLLLTSCAPSPSAADGSVTADPSAQDGAASLPAQMPADFAIRFVSQTGNEEIYDTHTGLIQKDLVQNGTATAEFTPSRETLAEIYAKAVECRICEIDRVMNNSVLTRADGQVYGVKPLTRYTVTITADGHTYTIRGDITAQGYTDVDPDAARFIEFVSFMYRILVGSPEYQALPEAVGGYQ